jgi:hypothetical protein
MLHYQIMQNIIWFYQAKQKVQVNVDNICKLNEVTTARPGQSS